MLHMLLFKDMYISCNKAPKYRPSPFLGVQLEKQQSVSILKEKLTVLDLLLSYYICILFFRGI